MKKGDIILVQGKIDPIAFLIRKSLKTAYNHVGIFIDSKNILEVGGRRTRIVPSSKYRHNSRYKYKIVRITGLSKDKIDKVIDYIIQVNEKNYFKWLSACFMVFFDSKKELPRRTCSGLIAEGLSKVGFYFNKHKNPHHITPKDISNSKRWKRII
jgi:hypothetical protein